MQLILQNLSPIGVPLTSADEPWPMYLPPEQKVSPHRTGFKGDIWLLGSKPTVWGWLKTMWFSLAVMKSRDDRALEVFVRITNGGEEPVAVTIDGERYSFTLPTGATRSYLAYHWIQLMECDNV